MLMPLTRYGIIWLIAEDEAFSINRAWQPSYQFSTHRPIRAGVPQVSLLGPKLFFLFTSDVLGLPHTNMATKLQRSLDLIAKWSQRWGLRHEFTQSSPPPPPSPPRMKVLPWCHQIWYLGVALDPLLCDKRSLGLKIKLLIHTVTFWPILAYGALIWSRTTISQRRRLNLLQTRVLQMFVKALQFVGKAQIHKDLPFLTPKKHALNRKQLRHQWKDSRRSTVQHAVTTRPTPSGGDGLSPVGPFPRAKRPS